MITTRNPATGQVIKQYPLMTLPVVEKIIAAVNTAQQDWRETPLNERFECFKNLIHLLDKNLQTFSNIITEEMGKPIAGARDEIKKCQWLCEYYMTHAEEYLTPIQVKTKLKKSYICYQPLGIIFAIMPWNYPFWQVFRFAVPNLIAGNAAILNHAPISTGASLLIENVFDEAGFPKNLFRSIIASHDVAKAVIQHDLIAGVTLTGSDKAGRAVASVASERVKKLVLELGGCDPYLVLADASIDLAVEKVLQSRMNNSGQVCIAAKRVILEAPIYDIFLSKIKHQIKQFTFGDPHKETTILGPLAREDIRETVHQQVQESVAAGAKLICGGFIPEGPGFFYPPTILSEVKPGMVAFDDEIFGPVVTLCRAKDEDDAIRLANASRYGLSAAVFTQDVKKGERIARDKINVGTCVVNGLVRSDPHLPFGGIKQSGYGRELGMVGLHEFLNIKTIGIA
jgi:succinate-semialdehyde dehydrogenase/glutarate-semialdehyde dehydrogenase